MDQAVARREPPNTMSWLRHPRALVLALLAVGTISLTAGWYQKLGYLDAIARGARATEQGRFDNTDLEQAGRNVFAARDLVAYHQGVRAAAAGRLARATERFLDVVSRSQSPTLRARAYYNLGNLLALQGKVQDAVEMYREALRLDPSDWDAKSNLEALYAQRAIPEAERTGGSLTQAREGGEDAGPDSGGVADTGI